MIRPSNFCFICHCELDSDDFDTCASPRCVTIHTVCHTSADDGRKAVMRCKNAVALNEAKLYEQTGANRKTLIAAIERRIKQLG